MGLSMAAFRVCGICPYTSAAVLASRYICQAEQEAELEDRATNPRRLSTGSQVLTSPEFLSSLRSRGALAEADVDPGGEVPEDGTSSTTPSRMPARGTPTVWKMERLMWSCEWDWFVPSVLGLMSLTSRH
jgi:hypothetical protein